MESQDERCDATLRWRRLLIDGIGDSDALLPLLRDALFAGDAGLANDRLDACADRALEALLRSNTEEAHELGVFGVPTSILTRRSAAGVTSELFWGQGRLAPMKEAIRTSSD